MTSAKLLVDASSVSLRGAFPATGDIVLALGRERFPSAGWNDFVIVILGEWIDALGRLVNDKTTKSKRVHFMEGPYAVDLMRVDSERFRVRALYRPVRGERVRAVVDVDSLSLIENGLEAAEAVLAVCRKASHTSKDVRLLEQASASLRDGLRRRT